MKWNISKIHPVKIFIIFGILSIWLLHTDGDKLGSDGNDYFMYCRNLFFYGDLKFHLADQNIANERFQGNMKNGVLQTPFSIGPALAWLPFYTLAHGVTLIESIWNKREINGFERNYREIIGWGTVIYIFIGLYLLYLFLLKLNIPSHIALICIFSGYFGTFLINYAIFESSMAHGISFFTIALYLFLWQQFKSQLDYKKYFLLGLVLGFAMLMRYTNVIFLLIPFIDLLRHFNWKKVWHFFALGISALLTFSLQMLAWKTCFGKYLLIPQGENFMIWAQPKILEVLFSCKHGLFTHHWLILIGLIGFIYLAKKKQLDRCGFLLIFIFLVYFNSVAKDWYAGHSFGNRRFDSLLPFVILGLSVPLMYIESLLLRNKKVILICLLSPFVCYNLFYLHYFRKNIQKREQVITPTEILDYAYQKTGSLVNFPSNLFLALRYHIPLGKAEMLLGNYIDIDQSGLIYPAVDKVFLIDGWSKDTLLTGNRPLRLIKDNVARIGFAMRNLQDRNLQIKFAVLENMKGFQVQIKLNGSTFALETIQAGEVLSIPIKREILDPLLNILSIRIVADPAYPLQIAIKWILVQ